MAELTMPSSHEIARSERPGAPVTASWSRASRLISWMTSAWARSRMPAICETFSFLGHLQAPMALLESAECFSRLRQTCRFIGRGEATILRQLERSHGLRARRRTPCGSERHNGNIACLRPDCGWRRHSERNSGCRRTPAHSILRRYGRTCRRRSAGWRSGSGAIGFALPRADRPSDRKSVV